MARFVLQRLGESLIVMLIMSFVIYGLIGLMPGAPIALLINADPRLTAEDAARLRLRRAVCHLSDLAWREHSDYRAGQAVYRLLHHPFSGLDHEGRAFVAYAVFNRYGGGPKAPEAATARALLTAEALARARILGLALRLAYRLTAGTPALLESTKLAIVDGKLRLILPSDGSVPHGEAVEARFKALVEACDTEPGGIVVA